MCWAMLLVVLCSTGDVGATAAVRPMRTTTGLSPQEEEVFAWASSLYEEAGLRLPAIDVIGHETMEACGGGAGYHHAEGGRSTIDICGEHPRRFDEVLFLHELAHAWDLAVLTDTRRAAFAELRGVTQWWDDGVHDWDERGAEHAAEIVTWALRDRPMRVFSIPDADCASLEAGYVALTGRPPLHGYRDRC
jgi:hypothetical protein